MFRIMAIEQRDYSFLAACVNANDLFGTDGQERGKPDSASGSTILGHNLHRPGHHHLVGLDHIPERVVLRAGFSNDVRPTGQ